MGIAVLVICVMIFQSGFYDAVIGRALSRFFGNFVDKGSMARVRMWRYVLQTSAQYPMGCGVGNCMKALTAVSNETYVDGNLHNVYLQNLIDQGWIGGIFYIGLVLRFFWRKKEECFSNPFVAALFSYCVISLVQFRGADTLILLLLGIELAKSKDKMENEYYVVKRR